MADKARTLYGQCRLQVDSTSQISLQRYHGFHLPLKISGTWEAKAIPASGPTLANTGLTQATLYYIYAFDNAGTLTLEASTTGHTTDADTGVEIKSGDASRTLVGMVYMDTGTPGLFRDTTSKRWCLNWYNRRDLDLTGTFSADRTVSSATLAEINSEIRLQFLAWADEAVEMGASGTHMNSANGNATASAIGIDSTSVSTQMSMYTNPAANNSQRGPIALWVSQMLSEGFHFVTLLGAATSGTSTWHTADGIGTGTAKTRMWGRVRG